MEGNIGLIQTLADELKAAHNELCAVKKRNLVLLHAFEYIERERLAMYALITDFNRCTDCAKYGDCRKKRSESSTYRAKQTHPEIYCSEWMYSGKYTQADEILALARKARESASKVPQ